MRAAVYGAKDTPLAIRAVGVSQRGHVDEVRVRWVYADLGNVPGVFQSDVDPGGAGVGAAIDAVTMGHVAADAGFAGADVEHVGIGRRHGNRADGGSVQIAVGDVAPGDTAIDGLPDAAGTGAVVEGQRLGRVAGHRHHAPGPVRPDQPPAHEAGKGIVQRCFFTCRQLIPLPRYQVGA